MSVNRSSARNAVGDLAARKSAADREFRLAARDLFEQSAAKAGLDLAEGKLDPDVLSDRLYDELKTKHVREIDDPDDRLDPAKSSSKVELTEAIFTGGPTAKDAERDDLTKAVWEMCSTAVWDLVRPGRRGRVQQRLEADKLLLVRGKVYRHGNPIATGIYVSTQRDIVEREYLGPRLARFLNLVAAIEDDYSFAVELDSDLAGPLREAIAAATNEALAKLPVKQLGSDETAGRRALES